MIEPIISYLLGNCSCSSETQYLAFDSDRCFSLTHKRIHDEAEASWKRTNLRIELFNTLTLVAKVSDDYLEEGILEDYMEDDHMEEIIDKERTTIKSRGHNTRRVEMNWIKQIYKTRQDKARLQELAKTMTNYYYLGKIAA